jgi:hypothetical protein
VVGEREPLKTGEKWGRRIKMKVEFPLVTEFISESTDFST